MVVTFDTSVFVALLRHREDMSGSGAGPSRARASIAAVWCLSALDTPPTIVVPAVVVAELCSYHQPHVVMSILDSVRASTNVVVPPLDDRAARLAGRAFREFKERTTGSLEPQPGQQERRRYSKDALVVGSALAVGSELILTWDNKFSSAMRTPKLFIRNVAKWVEEQTRSRVPHVPAGKQGKLI